MIVFGQMGARTKTTNYRAPIRALAKRDPRRYRKRLSIGNSIVTRYFQNVQILKSLDFVTFPSSLVFATREKNPQSMKRSRSEMNISLIAIFQ